MSAPHFMAFLPELVLLAGALVLFVLCVVPTRLALARGVALATAVGATGATLLVFGSTATLFDGAYQVDRFSQTLKLVFTAGFALQLLLQGRLPDIRESVKPEYFLFLTLSVSGLTMLVSCVELIALLVALQLSAFPVYLLVAMRNESEHHRQQMESAIKYIMFGVAANGIMLFGMSYLFGLTGTTSWPTMIARLQPVLGWLGDTGTLVLMAWLFWFGLKLVANNRDVETVTLFFNYAVVYAILPVAALAIAALTLARMRERVRQSTYASRERDHSGSLL